MTGGAYVSMRGGTVSSHNGPVCTRCNVGYIDTHVCDPDVLIAMATELIAEAARIRDTAAKKAAERWDLRITTDQLPGQALCPCRPENGGSGVCSCILGGVKVTC